MASRGEAAAVTTLARTSKTGDGARALAALVVAGLVASAALLLRRRLRPGVRPPGGCLLESRAGGRTDGSRRTRLTQPARRLGLFSKEQLERTTPESQLQNLDVKMTLYLLVPFTGF